MLFQYKGFVVDATPDFSLGEFWARARIAPGALNVPQQPWTVDQPDLGHFSREALAIEHAITWAREWVDARKGSDQPGSSV